MCHLTRKIRVGISWAKKWAFCTFPPLIEHKNQPSSVTSPPSCCCQKGAWRGNSRFCTRYTNPYVLRRFGGAAAGVRGARRTDGRSDATEGRQMVGNTRLTTTRCGRHGGSRRLRTPALPYAAPLVGSGEADDDRKLAEIFGEIERRFSAVFPHVFTHLLSGAKGPPALPTVVPPAGSLTGHRYRRLRSAPISVSPPLRGQSTGTTATPALSASPITRLPLSAPIDPPRYMPARERRVMAKIVHSDFFVSSSPPRHHKRSHERHHLRHALRHTLPHPALRPDSPPPLTRPAADGPTSHRHRRALPRLCAKALFTFVNLESGHEIDHPPPWSKITQAWRALFLTIYSVIQDYCSLFS